MNDLENLIAKLCPDGVEFKYFSDVAEYVRGITYGKYDELQNELSNGIPVMRANNITIGQNELNFCDVKYVRNTVKIKSTQFLKKDDILICAGSGSKEHIGKVAYIFGDMEYSFGGFMAVVREKNPSELLPRFMFHILTSSRFRDYIRSEIDSSTINNLNSKVISNFKIPIPPIEVQKEIVRILDKFTELISLLQRELDLRRKQYEFYRDQLLTFDEIDLGVGGHQLLTIDDVCVKISSGGTPKTSNRSFYNGNIPWLRTQDIDFNEIYSTSMTITEDGLNNSTAKMIPINCVIVAMYGATAAKVAVNKIQLATNQACCNLQPDEKIVNYRYLYHWLARNYQELKSLGEGSQNNINAQKIKSFEIPIPPIEVQKKIVEILDRFDKLCNDLTVGIPAEIKVRQKQYEFYRDKLLTFKDRFAI